MSDRVTIAAGLGLFLVVGALPLWNAGIASADPARPALEPAADTSGCLEDTTWMKANHPVLLNQWRTAVVRDGEREWGASDGRHWDMSLTGTCLRCHTSSDAFCTRCHEYADVEPTCWSCHVVPEGGAP